MRISDWSSDVCSSDLNPKDHVSHFFLQYAVNTGNFADNTLIYPSRFVELWIRAEATKLEFVDAVNCLGEALRVKLPERARPLLETVTFGMLARKVSNWQLDIPSALAEAAEAAEAAANIDDERESAPNTPLEPGRRQTRVCF